MIYKALCCSTLACMSLLIGAAGARPDESSWMICTRNLELFERIVIKADEESVVVVDSIGLRETLPINELFFALSTHEQSKAQIQSDMETNAVSVEQDQPIVDDDEVSAMSWYITLIDGQVIGAIIKPSPDPDMLSCSVLAGRVLVGQAMIPLESVLMIAREPGDLSEIDNDTITTRSGDVLVGFIESVGEHITIGPSRIKLTQIETLRFANIYEPTPGVYLSTTDKLVLKARSLDFDFEHPLKLRIDPDALGLIGDVRDELMMEPDAPAGIEVVHSDVALVALSTINPTLIEPTGGRDWTPAPVVQFSSLDPVLATIDLRAPVRVLYPLPAGSTRFACELVAPINTWTDCIATITTISYAGQRTELLRQRLHAEHPSQSLNAVLGEDIKELEIRIDPGESGPIQDRVLIKNPRLLVLSNLK